MLVHVDLKNKIFFEKETSFFIDIKLRVQENYTTFFPCPSFSRISKLLSSDLF